MRYRINEVQKRVRMYICAIPWIIVHKYGRCASMFAIERAISYCMHERVSILDLC